MPSTMGRLMYDAIVVLGGGKELSVGRIEEGIRLFKQGIAKYLIVVAGKDDAPLMRERIVEEIKDLSNVYIDDNSTSTVDNAYYAKRILVKLNARRILIVTSKFHLKRALSVFKLFLRDGYEIEGVGVEDNPDDCTLTKGMYLDELLYLLDYFQGMSDEKIKAIFDVIKGPVNKILRKAYESGILPKPKK